MILRWHGQLVSAFWIGVFLWLGSVFPVVVIISTVAITTEDPVGLVFSAVLVIVAVLIPVAAASHTLWLSPLRAAIRRSRMRRAGKALGLSPAVLSKDDRASCNNLTLFRFAGERVSKCTGVLKGEREGTAVLVFDHAFMGAWKDPDDVWRWARYAQTVAVLPGAGPLADFHAGPAEEWDELLPDWHLGLGLFLRQGRIRARDGATFALLDSPEVQTGLAGLENFVIECSGGTLLVYRLDHLVRPAEFANFVSSAARVGLAFRGCAGHQPPQALAPVPTTQSPADYGNEPPLPPRRSPSPLFQTLVCLGPMLVVLLIAIISHTWWAIAGPTPGVAPIVRMLGVNPGLLLFCTVLSVVLTVLACSEHLKVSWRGWRLLRAGRSLGFRSENWVGELNEMPLARFIHPDVLRLSSWSLVGVIDRHDIRVLDLQFNVVFWPPSDKQPAYGSSQTVALLAGLGAKARFTLGPSNPYLEAFSGWAGRQGLTLKTTLPEAELHANLDAGLSGLTLPLAMRLAAFEGWPIEGANGLVMVYRLGVRVEPADLGHFLEAVRRIATVLEEARSGTEDIGPAPRAPAPDQTGLTRRPDGVEPMDGE